MFPFQIIVRRTQWGIYRLLASLRSLPLFVPPLSYLHLAIGACSTTGVFWQVRQVVFRWWWNAFENHGIEDAGVVQPSCVVWGVTVGLKLANDTTTNRLHR